MKTEKYEVLRYLFIGGCTTILNIATFYMLTNFVNMNYMTANIFAWIVGVTFAYVTNKFFVFRSSNQQKHDLFKEISTFFIARTASLGIDQLLIYLFIGILFVNPTLSKLISNVVVVIVNYILSKFIVFRK